MLLVLHNVTMASLRTFARKVAADDETWRNNNQTWARANFSFFIYFLFQIKWHFEFFFTEIWGVDIHPIHSPCIRPCFKAMLEHHRDSWHLFIITQALSSKGRISKLLYVCRRGRNVSGTVYLCLVTDRTFFHLSPLTSNLKNIIFIRVFTTTTGSHFFHFSLNWNTPTLLRVISMFQNSLVCVLPQLSLL